VRIPLDYYRILGVTIQASTEQLARAYEDRSLQLPRQEYSNKAIAARKELLEEAYNILCEPDKRAEYNLKFLERTGQIDESFDGETEQETEKNNTDDLSPYIEIDPKLFVGALVILQELAEYELVLRLGEPYSRSLEKNQRGIRADVILTVALAYLELGREQWQENQYQNAAISGQMGLDLLLREQLFPSIRDEIQTDLCKLRPYLILQLLSEEPEHAASKKKGKHLLQEMLDDRGGIEGDFEDRSGLSIDDFLRFIQQIRTYLSSSEQIDLFETEAKRPSAVAAYLALYALLARGFAQKKPSLIVRARAILNDLEQRQEVYLEKAVCALLLGKTDRACQALQQSQELEPLAFIREHSEGSPDLLPGLCLYAQRWLTTEVFSHFHDLAETQVSLDDYFGDREVQAYLDRLSEVVEAESKQAAKTRAKKEQKESERQQIEAIATPANNPAKQLKLAYQNIRSRFTAQKEEVAVAAEVRQAPVTNSKHRQKFAVAFSPVRFSPLTDLGQLSQATGTSFDRPARVQSQQEKPSPKQTISGKSDRKVSNKLLLFWTKIMNNVNNNSAKDRVRVRRRSSLKVKRLLLLGLPLFVGLGVLGFAYKWSQIDNSAISISKDEFPLDSLDSSANPNSETSEVVFSEQILNETTARSAIETWLKNKSLAFGVDRQIDELNEILVDPLLTRQRNAAVYFKNNNAHRIYNHAIKIELVKANPENPHLATVDARVKEAATHYQNNSYDRASSYDDNLLVRYHMVRHDGSWFIKDINVLQ